MKLVEPICDSPGKGHILFYSIGLVLLIGSQWYLAATTMIPNSVPIGVSFGTLMSVIFVFAFTVSVYKRIRIDNFSISQSGLFDRRIEFSEINHIYFTSKELRVVSKDCRISLTSDFAARDEVATFLVHYLKENNMLDRVRITGEPEALLK